MTVSCELPAPAMTCGLKLAVPTPDGSPVSDSATSSAKPLSEVTPTVYVAPAPATTFRLAGVADRLKSGGAVTTSVAAALWTVAPLVAVIVSG